MKVRDRWFDRLGVISGTALPPLFYAYGRGILLPLLLGSLFVFFLYGMLRKRDLRDSAFDVSFKVLGIVYIALPLSYLAYVRGLPNGEYWILFLLFVIWANDTCAYFTGKTFGKRKLLPEISPKKTVEGAIGGLLGGAVVALVFNWYLDTGLGTAGAVGLSAAIGVIGMIGDLAESLLKRGAGVKDSGTILPGHGGMLDRIDSLLFPIPFLYYFLICNSAG